MNERFEDLANQCQHRYSEHNIDLEKFAAMLVLECAAFVEGAAEVYDQEQQLACERAAMGLRNYFGVEE